MSKFHRLLNRQLKKVGFDEEKQAQLAPLLEQVNEAYVSFDNDLLSAENILEKSSQELFQANQQLKDSVATISSQLAKIAGNIKDVIFEIDLKGNWSYLNPAWEKLSGAKVKDALGQPYSKFLRDQDGNPIKNLIDLKNPLTNNFTKTFRSLVNERGVKWFEFSLKVITSSDDKAEGYIGTIADISNLKETERALIEAKEKETAANRAKDDFLSTMSHEIRTPLNAVIGISNLLLLENPKKAQLENLKALKYSSEHLLELVNDILDFNKIASGALKLEHTDFCLDDILKGLSRIFSTKAKTKDIIFTVRKDIELSGALKGDSTRISQILTNLINNAIKFTEEGRVVLDIEVLEQTEDTYLLDFKVTDTGIGIPEDKKDKIFQSFEQASEDTTRKYGGTGLGLAICKKLLLLMQTDLKVESEVGKGSEFSFHLAMEKGKTQELPSKELEEIQNSIEDPAYMKDARILVAEDNKVNIMVIKKFLNKWNLEFDIAENGQEAVDKTKENTYDLILMDLQMPVMNGFEACKSIREDHQTPNKDIPIYALSASTGVDIREEIKKFGLDGLISKPFNPTELHKMIIKILSKEVATS